VAPAAYWFFLAALPAAGLVARVASARLPLAPLAYRLRPVESLLAVGALIALGFHCSAMFFPAEVEALPGLEGPAEAVADLGTASQLAYWLPAVVLVVGVRRVWRSALVALTAVLVVVGVTMFWSFGLSAHLAAIAAAVAITVAIAAGLVRTPTGQP